MSHPSPQEGRIAGTHGLDWVGLAATPMLALLVLPLIALVLRASPADVRDALRQPAAHMAMRLSLTTSLASLGLVLLLGTPVAWLVGRRRFWGRALLDALIDLPMVLPPAVAGIALLMAFGRRGLVGSLLHEAGVTIVFTPVAVILAQTFVAAPFYLRAAGAAFGAAQHDLEEAARLDGANAAAVLRYITLPLDAPLLAGGAVMSWARALGEFGATIIFAGNLPGRTQTMPLAIYLGFELDLALALALSILLMAVAFAVLIVVKWILQARF